ncbi:hypothetical protein A7M00_15755 [Acinetobacter baumannii]|uniref:DUF1173 domain-containing protein n=1 Tax=Acinetobacter baumannii TaxID=470 RepID=UPI0008DC5BEA|nr:DUF1173 domain-containing protein [Acinetobacter baumannii]MCP9158829.1 DUF1173 domain-containing protein [Acinetobacter baumannii]OIE44889.1 hypothetical protein A7M00_15755 [Acinetobacter baumannii]OIE45458.1 hypothetical protein A7L69_17660 [Acinetobacter baumannii]
MKYQFGNDVIDGNFSGLQQILKQFYERKRRPLCLCTEPGIELYIAKVNDSYILKRMPKTGGLHSPICMSFEPPEELSGLGEVQGQAIQENLEDGTTNLKLDFSLTKIPGKAPPAPSGADSDSVRTDGKKLTLRGLLHYLFEEARLNYWNPDIPRRNWYNVRKALLNASDSKIAKRASLTDNLYIPELFDDKKIREITSRRNEKLAHMNTGKNSQSLMILIGIVKEISEARYDYKMVVKHCPDFHFMMNKDLHKRIYKRFQEDLELWGINESSQLITISTFTRGTSGVANLEEVSLMVVNEQWIPYENIYEFQLISEMIAENRPFIKGLRYNLDRKKPLSSLVDLNALPEPTAMYIIPPAQSHTYRESVDNLIQQSDYLGWIWEAEMAMPELPIHKTQIEEKDE